MQWTDILAPKETWKGFMLLSDITAYEYYGWWPM